ncbi:MAG: hypothetical protein IJV85_02080 [Clostridia bacterium]|nr:hypothetical protein [Clostridia bacterium]
MKILKRLSLLLMMICVCWMYSSCMLLGSPVGTYKFQSLTYTTPTAIGSLKVEWTVGDTDVTGFTYTEDFYTITLKEDGTATSVTQFGEEAVTFEGTWVQAGFANVEISFDGEPLVWRRQGDLLQCSFEFEGTVNEYVLKKV